MSYLKWKEQTITDFSDKNINRLYDDGYVFGRVEKGYMSQTRSLRIDLSRFKLSSENKRIFRKTEGLQITTYQLPFTNYHWSIGKMAKDFYTEKFGDGTFSANKVRELLTTQHNFNRLFTYSIEEKENIEIEENKKLKEIGYCIALETDELIHYSYPFYELGTLNFELKNCGMGMMLHAILYAQEAGKKYIYLGSFQRPGDIYKLQFEGLEWFSKDGWNTKINVLKNIF